MDGHAAESGDRMNMEETAFIKKDKAGEGSEDGYPLLTKEDLLRIDREEPIWRRLRIALIVLFWAVWIGLIVVSALFIVFTPRCPPRPTQEFWQSKTAYWVNPFAFKDSDGDLVGDLQGLVNAADYIQEEVGAGFIILTSMLPLYPRDIAKPGNVSFRHIHPALGTMDDFGALLHTFKKRGMPIVITLDFNAVPVTHELAKPAFLTAAGAKFCRTGNKSSELVDGKSYYSTYGKGSGVVDLNLRSRKVLEEVKNVTRFWLSKGVDGILLADAAFYVEDESACTSKSWFSEFPTCKLYTPETVSVIQELRKVVDAVSTETSRHRVLIADPGDTGYSETRRMGTMSLLGTEDAPGAHLVISREFVFNRGSEKDAGDFPSLSKYLRSVNASLQDRLALTVSSPTDKPYYSVFSVASVFLLPGTPVIYAGSELGWSPLSVLPPKLLYPFGEMPAVGDVPSHLPMPWSSNGHGFSDSEKIGELYTAYLAAVEAVETVETALAAGRGPSVFNLTTSLVRLHKEYPSLLWGSLNSTMRITEISSVEVFKRSAVGFDSILVALVAEGKPGSVVDFTPECSGIVPLVIYPPNEAFEMGVEVQNLKVYFKSAKEDTLYVFKCSG